MSARNDPAEKPLILSPAAAASAAVHGALLESRQRWQDLASLSADLVFETDQEGRFTFLWPDTVLGHRSAALLGRRADSLLLGAGPNPFTRRQPVRGHRAWFADAAGQPRCLSLSLAPLGDARGAFAGLRGTAQDVTREEQAANAAAAGLRRAALVDALTETVRRAASPADALAHGLKELRDALGCAGTAMLLREGEAARLACGTGEPPAELIALGGDLLRDGRDFADRLPGGEPAALFHHLGQPRALSALAAWRGPAGRAWDAEELSVLRAMAAMLGALLGFTRMQEELERKAMTDALTGLENRRAFLAALRARLEAGEAGALLFLDLDNLKPLNDQHGHEAGDAALRETAALLRRSAAPGDLIARFGGDEFVFWLAGADAQAASARAAGLLAAAAASKAAYAPRFSIGIATWDPASGENHSRLIARADAALYAAKRSARGSWKMAEAAS
jgi:diguanylate cyclase (GGDEF)-like protein